MEKKKENGALLVFIIAFHLMYMTDYYYSKLFYGGETRVSIYNATTLLNNWSQGYNMRGFVGTVLYVFKMNWTRLGILAILVTSIMLFLVSVIFLMIYNKYDRNSVCLIVCLIVAISPLFRTYYAYYLYGGLDVYQMIYTLLQLIILMKEKEELYWVIPILTIIGSITHQGYIFEFGSVATFILLYKSFEDKKIKSRVVLTINSVVLVALFFCQQLCVSQTEEEIATIETYISARLGSVKGGLLASINGGVIANQLEKYQDSQFVISRLFGIPLFLILYWPFVLWGVVIIAQVYSHMTGKRDRFLVTVGWMSPIIFSAPNIMLNSDTARFMNLMFVNEFFIIAYFLYKRHTIMDVLIMELKEKIRNLRSVVLLAIVWIDLIGCLGWKYGNYQINNLVLGLIDVIQG